MNKATAEAMATKVKEEVGSRGRVAVEYMPGFMIYDRSYWWVQVIIDNQAHLGFAEPHQWTKLSKQYLNT